MITALLALILIGLAPRWGMLAVAVLLLCFYPETTLGIVFMILFMMIAIGTVSCFCVGINKAISLIKKEQE